MATRRVFRIVSVSALLIPVIFVLAFFSVSNAAPVNKLANGNFEASSGAWQNATGGAGCYGGKPSLGEWQQNSLNFSYWMNTVTQQVTIETPTELLLTYDVQDRYEPYINGRYEVSISGMSGYTTSGLNIAPDEKTQFSLSYTTTEPSEVLTISISGDDGGIFWAGCYGPSISAINLIYINEQPQYPEHIYGEVFENQTMYLSAPDGFVFSDVLFASYGTPTEYGYGSCHSEQSSQAVREAFIGKKSSEIIASNSIFGDPCPGVYKKLIVALTYEQESPPTTLPPETTIPPTTIPPETTVPPTLPPVPTVPPTLPPETTVPVPSETIPTQPSEPTTPETTIPLAEEKEPENTPTSPPDDNKDINQILDGGITFSEAISAISDSNLLSSVSESEAKELFSAIDISEITKEEAAAIVAAVQNAPEGVRKAFEATVDVFSGQFDGYVMTGSKINVGDRRTIVAVTIVGSLAAVMTQPIAPSPSRGGSSSQQGPSSSSTAYKKEEEQEENEPAGEIAGDGVDWIKSISIYKEINGEKVMNWKAFIKKFLFGVMNLGFTISGSIVVYFTLSGTIQKIALFSTLVALAAALYLHMHEPKED